MPGTRTAPLWTATATNRLATLQLIDASGDTWAESYYVPVASTAAQLETWAAAYAAASQASLYGLIDSTNRLGDPDPDNAMVGQRNSVAEGVNMLMKNNSIVKTITPRLVAPIADVMQGNQDIPLFSATEMTNLITAILALQPGYAFLSGQYTGRRERKNNPRIKA